MDRCKTEISDEVGIRTAKILGINLGMFYPDEDYSEIEMYKREFLPMMDDLMKTAKFVPQTVSLTHDDSWFMNHKLLIHVI